MFIDQIRRFAAGVLRALAPDYRDPKRRHRRQPRHGARRDMAADRRDADAPGISLRSLHSEPLRCGGHPKVARQRRNSGSVIDEPLPTRGHFTNLRAFSDEIANARICAGFHYRFSTIAGSEMGQKIGAYVVKSAMQPAQTAMSR